MSFRKSIVIKYCHLGVISSTTLQNDHQFPLTCPICQHRLNICPLHLYGFNLLSLLSAKEYSYEVWCQNRNPCMMVWKNNNAISNDGIAGEERAGHVVVTLFSFSHSDCKRYIINVHHTPNERAKSWGHISNLLYCHIIFQEVSHWIMKQVGPHN